MPRVYGSDRAIPLTRESIFTPITYEPIIKTMVLMRHVFPSNHPMLKSLWRYLKADYENTHGSRIPPILRNPNTPHLGMVAIYGRPCIGKTTFACELVNIWNSMSPPNNIICCSSILNSSEYNELPNVLYKSHEELEAFVLSPDFIQLINDTETYNILILDETPNMTHNRNVKKLIYGARHFKFNIVLVERAEWYIPVDIRFQHKYAVFLE